MPPPTPYRPHDLIRVRDLDALLAASAPTWMRRSLTRAPWVVVRRAQAPAGQVAVGVRGRVRHERHAVSLLVSDVGTLVPPESLREPAAAVAGAVPAMRALRACRRILGGDLCWGPTGSIGFELATGRATATATSDLDLVIRRSALPSSRWAADLLAQLAELPVRVDCQLDTPAGAVALAELAADPATIVLRTSAGPELVSRRIGWHDTATGPAPPA